ncbi:AMP-binding protein [Sphingomonas sp. YL-JM2C]
MSEGIGDVVRFWASRLPDRAAIRVPGREIGWAEFNRLTDELAAGFSRSGIGRGDVVGILLGNRVEFLEVMIAAMKIGAIVELLNIRLTPAELVHPVTDAAARLVVTEPGMIDLLSLAVKARPDLRIAVTEPVPGCELLTAMRVSGGRPAPIDIARGDPAVISYTSGTTGVPKGALLSHGAIRAGGINHSLARPLSFEDRILLALPLAFAGGAVTTYLGWAVISGATMVIAPNSDPETLLHILETERITAWPSVSTICEMMVAHPRFNEIDLSRLRFAMTGGAPVSQELLRAWQARGVALTQGYGSTETSGQSASILFGEDAVRKLGSAGRPMMHIDARVVDDQDNDVPVGTAGELILRGPILFSGYLNRPEEMAQAMRGGWLHTGDMAQFDDEGFLTIVDRLKDMIISGGLNVYPAEIERSLARRAGLEQFAVIGVADQRWGEVPMIVACGLDKVDLPELAKICATELADYKRPRYIVGHDGPLPVTMSGKVLKKPLRDLHATIPADAVDLKNLVRRETA